MASVTVTPAEFTYVFFDNATLEALVAQMRDLLGLGHRDIVVDVQEQVPFGRALVTSLDPITLSIESGALEDPLRPRQLSRPGSADIVGVLLLRARDLLHDGFDGPPLDESLAQPLQIAWDTYCVARTTRALAEVGHPIEGFRPQVQRRRYTFRTRHGFSDVADQQFERLWTSDGLTWPEIVAMSDRARAASTTAA